MSLLASSVGFKGGLFRQSGLLWSPYHYMLIITPANLFCSMHTQMNINATEDDSHVCVPLEHTQTDADRRQKLERHTKMSTLACSPCVAK